MSVAGTHKERASSDFRDGALNVVAGQGAIEEPGRALVWRGKNDAVGRFSRFEDAFSSRCL